MSTPSKEALEASSAIVRSLGITDEDRDLLATIIDRHFEPLRQRAENGDLPDTEAVRRFRAGLCQKCGELMEHGHDCDDITTSVPSASAAPEASPSPSSSPERSSP